MNCPTCKSPISSNTLACEWCGASLHPLKGNPTDRYSVFFSIRHVGHSSINKKHMAQIFIDGLKVGEGNIMDGFEVSGMSTRSKPTIIIKSYYGEKTIKLPSDQYFENGRSYVIILKASIWYNCLFSENPKEIIPL